MTFLCRIQKLRQNCASEYTGTGSKRDHWPGETPIRKTSELVSCRASFLLRQDTHGHAGSRHQETGLGDSSGERGGRVRGARGSSSRACRSARRATGRSCGLYRSARLKVTVSLLTAEADPEPDSKLPTVVPVGVEPDGAAWDPEVTKGTRPVHSEKVSVPVTLVEKGPLSRSVSDISPQTGLDSRRGGRRSESTCGESANGRACRVDARQNDRCAVERRAIGKSSEVGSVVHQTLETFDHVRVCSRSISVSRCQELTNSFQSRQSSRGRLDS